MNYYLKMKLRKISKKNKILHAIYLKASSTKTAHREKMSDEEFLKKAFKENTGKTLNLYNPQTFNEKLQWLKLYDRKPLYTQLVDKYRVREYVADKIGEEYLNELYGVYDRFDDIDFDKLPEKFVLKCNHDCGSIVICEDKNTFDYANAEKKLTKTLKKNYYYVGREWPYRDVEPKIVIEKYLKNDDGSDLNDYKFLCFNGNPEIMFVATNRAKGTKELKFDFFDMEYNHLPFWNDYPNADILPTKPKCFNEMRTLASELAKGIPFVRVDFFECNGNVYFGEMTFYHAGGMATFHPESWDKTLGDWIELPMLHNSNN